MKTYGKGKDAVRIHGTRWIGINIQEQNGYYWIVTYDGDNEFIGDHWPTKRQRKQFRNAVKW